MRIMTINVWGDYFKNPVDIRLDGIFDTVIKYRPDILGLQEMTANWYKSGLIEKLSEYRTIGFEKNYVPLLYKTNEFDLIECGFEPYAETPDSSKGITWAVLKNKSLNKSIGVFNTHLWWKEINISDDELRLKNIKQLYSGMKQIEEKYNVPTVAFGDFNAKEGCLALKFLEDNNIYSSYKLADKFSRVSSWHGNPEKGDDGKYHGQKTNNDKTKSFDHILTEKGKIYITEQHVVEDQCVLDSTDHSPVFVDINL